MLGRKDVGQPREIRGSGLALESLRDRDRPPRIDRGSRLTGRKRRHNRSSIIDAAPFRQTEPRARQPTCPPMARSQPAAIAAHGPIFQTPRSRGDPHLARGRNPSPRRLAPVAAPQEGFSPTLKPAALEDRVNLPQAQPAQARRPAAQPPKGWRRTRVWLRSGPVEIRSMGRPLRRSSVSK